MSRLSSKKASCRLVVVSHCRHRVSFTSLPCVHTSIGHVHADGCIVTLEWPSVSALEVHGTRN